MVSGGWHANTAPETGTLTILGDGPHGGNSSWMAHVYNGTTKTIPLTIYALCQATT
ncbi:hypothetical protein DSC45_23555 [Streptomyces sp. YIM 130001]|nr:hypothetical protein DSC45_23555 [Streptomyces sp. YIM 130001]